MIDWKKSMEQTYEYYIVDPNTWGDVRLLDDVISCKITRDLNAETLGNSSMECDTDLTDKYVRAYLVVVQDREKRKIPLGTHLYQTPSITYDGRKKSMTQDGYTPLIELKEKVMTPGYTITNVGTNTPIYPVALGAGIVSESLRAPTIMPEADAGSSLTEMSFMSELSDTRLSFVTDLLGLCNYRLGLDELSRVIFEPNQALNAMRPIFEFNDDNSSILAPAISMQRDLYGIPNVVEVIYSTADAPYLSSVQRNTDTDSIVSIPARGREVWYRETDPNVQAGVTQVQLNEYAKNLLKNKSSIEYTITYTHGYCDVRIGDCVRLNYERAGIDGVNAKVIKQVIDCKSGCQAEETAVFTRSLMT